MRIIILTVLSAVIATVIAGCAVVKVPDATGGSKSDGTVDMSYEYGMFEKPQVQWDKALITARQRCQAWGYRDAEPFGRATEKCEAYNGYGNCVRQLVTRKYQCTGSN